MDSVLDIKKRIHDFIDHADERILRIIDAIVSTEIKTEKGLTEEHIEILEQRLKDHLQNPNSGKNWEILKSNIMKNYGF